MRRGIVTGRMRTWRRRLTGPVGRRFLLALAVAAAWAWWAWGPLAPVRSWSAPIDDAVPVSVSRDRTILVTVAEFPGALGPVRLWDLATGRERLKVLDAGAPRPIPYLAPDNSWLLTLDEKNGLILWDTATGTARAVLCPPDHAGNDPNRHSVVSSQDGRLIAAEQPDRQAVRLWESATGRLLATLDGACRPLVFTPDGQALATATQGTEAKLWDVATGRARFTFAGHASRVGAIAVSPDGRRLATGLLYSEPAPPMAVKLWDARTGQPVAAINAPQWEVAPALDFSPDSTWLVARWDDVHKLVSQELIWDITTDPPTSRDDLIATTGQPLAAGRQLDSASGLTFVPGGSRWLVADVADRALTLLEPRASSSGTTLRLRRDESVRFVSPRYSPTRRFVFSPDRRFVAVPTEYERSDLDVRLWRWVGRLAGWSLPTGNQGGHVFDLETGRERIALPRPLGWSKILDFAPDGETLWTAHFAPSGAGGWTVFEQWAEPSPWPPAWLLVVTALGVLLAVADWRRTRRPAVRSLGS